MTDENGVFVFKMDVVPASNYEIWIKPAPDKRGFIRRSTKDNTLDYLTLEMRKTAKISASGRKVRERRAINPVVNIFNKWDQGMFDDYKALIEQERPLPTSAFDTGEDSEGAFYRMPAMYTERDGTTKRSNVLLYVEAGDNQPLQVEEQFKYQVRALMKDGAQFVEHDALKEWMSDILELYPL